MSKSTILIVDKEKILVDLLARSLTSKDVEALGTTAADDALRLLDLHAPMLVVLDPAVAGGFALLKTLVSRGTKVLAVCSSEDVASTARAVGVQNIVERDGGFEVFIAAIRRLLDAPVSILGGTPSTSVLVTDDEEEIRNVLAEFMRTKGYGVRTAGNGVEAVRIVNEDPALQIVLLDVSMPEMGGMEALAHIMNRPNPPAVIMMTAVADREVARQALKTGAFDYILKPFDFSQIETSVIACLSHREYEKQPWWKRLTRR